MSAAVAVVPARNARYTITPEHREQMRAGAVASAVVRQEERADALTDAAPRVAAVLAFLAVETGVIEAVLLSRDRRPGVCEVRHTAMLALRLFDMTVAEIGRQLQRDHSSVLHGLEKARASIELAALAQRAAGAAGVPGEHTPVQTLLAHALHDQPHPTRAAVRAYIVGALLTRTRYDQRTAYYGLCLLVADVPLRQRVETLLQDCDMSGHVWRMREHARQAGLAWGA